MEKTNNLAVLLLLLLCGISRYCNGVPIRLAGGGSKFQGDVQVFYKGKWMSICDDHWDMRDAKVVCRQLGFSKALNFTTK